MRYGGFRTAAGVVRVLDIQSLPEFGGKLGESRALHPAYLAHLPDDKVYRATPETDPAQTDRIARAFRD